MQQSDTNAQNPKMLGFFSLLLCIIGFLSIILNSVELVSENPSWPLYFIALIFFLVGFIISAVLVFDSNATQHEKITEIVITIVLALLLAKVTLALGDGSDLIEILKAVSYLAILLNLVMGTILTIFGNMGLTRILNK